MKSCLIFFAFIISFSCHTGANKKVPLEGLAVQWAFSDQGVFMNENGMALQGSNLIQNYFKTNPEALLSSETLYAVPANPDSSIHYEIREGQTNTHEPCIILAILKKEQAADKVELLFKSKSNEASLPLEELNTRRNEWMRFCNMHHADSLVNELYTPDAFYFNHKPLIKGRADIIQEYGYMNQSDYHLELTPLRVVPVSDSLIFEIGQGSGSYGGKYILVWKKTNEGKWMIYMDSNI